MQDLTAISIAVSTLALPGPTNALLAVAGATGGVKRSLALVAAALVGYGIAITMLVALVGPAVSGSPVAVRLVRLLAAAILLHAAVGLWRRRLEVSGSCASAVTFKHVLTTTLFNPKAMVLATLLLPDGAGSPFVAWKLCSILPAIIAGSALLWIGIGATLSANAPRFLDHGRLERCAAAVLLCFAIVVTNNALA